MVHYPSHSLIYYQPEVLGKILDYGDRRGLNWNNGGGWNDATANVFPDWLQIDFNSPKSIDEIDVFTLQDNPATPAEPTETMTFTLYGLTSYDVQYWTGTAWATVPGGIITGNNKVWRKITFAPVTTNKIRVLTNASVDGYSRITELEAWGYESGGVNWLVTDHLGTPRMVIDQTGSLANVKRHDYLPFGEELYGGTEANPGPGGRKPSQGYGCDPSNPNCLPDRVRQQFSQKERDNETGLDYFLARYYSSTQGRFTSPDEFKGGAQEIYLPREREREKQALAYSDIFSPQSLNKYQYCLNNPLRYVDPDGHDWRIVEEKDEHNKSVKRYVWDGNYTYKEGDKNGAPPNARYIDTQGRAIQLWGSNSKDPNKEQTHGYQIVTAESKSEEVAIERLTEGTGAPPTSYSNVADTEKALLQAGYKSLNIDPFHSGSQFFKARGPTLHIIVGGKQVIVEDKRSGFTTYRARFAVDRVEFHADRFSQVKELGAHMKEAAKQFLGVQ